MSNPITKFIAAVFLVTASSTTFAHTGHGVSGFAAGFVHPLLGLDHLFAMVAVGLWAAQSSGRRMWLLPITFMVMLAVGAGISMQWQQPLPLLEIGIALSLLALGVLIALSLKLPVALSLALTALFGFFHGYAHGLELPASAAPLTYALGFLIATATLHLGGLAAGAATRHRYATLAKVAGGVIAASGIGLLTFS